MKKRTSYLAPEMEVLIFYVDRGFAASGHIDDVDYGGSFEDDEY